MTFNDDVFGPVRCNADNYQALLEHNKDDLNTILHQVVGLKSKDLIIAILTKYPDSYVELGNCKLIHCKEKLFGNTPLMTAISNTSIDGALMLLDEDVCPDPKDMIGQINAVDFYGKTPLMLAIAKGSSHICDLYGGESQSLIIDRLLELYNKPLSKLDGESKSQEEFQKEANDSGVFADINIRNEDGQTALHYAAAHRDLNLMEKLISLGAKIDIKDKYGNLPLDMVLCTPEQADSFLAENTGKVFTREKKRWDNFQEFMEEFSKKNFIHAPWDIIPKPPTLQLKKFVPILKDPEKRAVERDQMLIIKDEKLNNALDKFADCIPRKFSL